MNRNIEKLHLLAGKPERIIIGLMSGTSFDGLDVALCKIKGSGSGTEIELLHFETCRYENDFKRELKSVFSRHDADLERVCVLNAWVGLKQAGLVNDCLKKWNYNKEQIDLIASHGQTIYHAPKFLHGRENFPNATLQIGDGDHIAVATGIITISDFRQKHIAAGGEGAPLAVYGDYLIFSKKGENRIMLNIGGIANFTYLPGDLDASKVFSTDTGPGNTMMDAFMQKHFSNYFDENAVIAKKGKSNAALLEKLKEHSFFSKSFPKTIGPELFNLTYLQLAQKQSGTESLAPEDIMATLNRFSADTIMQALKVSFEKDKNYVVYVSGGGMHNPLLMSTIQSQMPGVPFHSTEILHINPDAKEAVLFALLANECVCGGPAAAEKKPGSPRMGEGRNSIPNVTMGKISFPD
jgi:anhydro-N-acetylmuramic acid kinase